MKRKAIRPKDCAYISPFDCLNAIVKKYDTPIADNINSMCISFILKNTEEINIKANSSAEVVSNYVFTKRKKTKNNIKKGKVCELKSWNEAAMNDLESQLAYHLTSEAQLPLLGLTLDPRQSLLKLQLEKQFVVHLFNFNSEDVTIHANSNICKIYIYALNTYMGLEN